VVLGCVGGSWMCRWFLNASVVLGSVGDSCVGGSRICR